MQFDWMDINVWGVIVSTVMFMVVGSIWYSPKVFFNTWLKLTGLKEEDIGMGKAIAGSLIVALMTSFLMDILVQATGSGDWFSGLILGIVVSLIAACVIASSALYSNFGLKHYFISTGYQVIVITVSAIILSIWR